MTKLLTTIDLKGSLVLEMNQDFIKIECTGQCVKIIFTSFKSLANFIYCYRNLRKHHSYLMEDHLSRLGFTYYLGDKLIGESNSYLPFSWLGYYFGIEKSQFYLSSLLNYIFQK